MLLDTGNNWFNAALIRISIRYRSVNTESWDECDSDCDTGRQFAVRLSDLRDILQHGHASHLLLDGSIGVDLAPKLGSVGCMIHLMKRGTWRSLSHLISWLQVVYCNNITQTDRFNMNSLHFLILQDWNWTFSNPVDMLSLSASCSKRGCLAKLPTR